MIYPMFAIYDRKVGFMTPTVDQNEATAMRNFEHAIMESASLLATHPGDYALYKIGAFDSESGELRHIDPEFIMDAKDVKV